MANVAIHGSTPAEGIVRLWKAPDVMVAYRLPVPVADADLVIEDLIGVIPHALQPVQPELGFVRKVQSVLRDSGTAHLIRKVPNSGEHHSHCVAGGLHEF